MPVSERFAFGDFVLERSRHRVRHRDGTPLNLTPRLFSALLLFVENPGELLTKDALLLALWPALVVEENNLSQVVSNLRRALGDDTQGSRYIQTVPRQGFRFVAAVTVLADQEAPAAAPAVEAAALAAPTPPADGSLVDVHAMPLSRPAPLRRRWLRGVLVTGSALGLGGGAWWMLNRAQVGRTPVRTTTLAVLPFRPLMTEGRDELLELGMADALISRLSTVPGLVVRSVGSVLRFGGTHQDPLRAARDLEVQWIVDGSLQRRGDQLRVTARLLWAADGSAAWSGSFDEKFTGVFELQDLIANRVLGALAPKLQARAAGTGDAGAPLTGIGGTRNTDAYQLYLTAWRYAQDLRGDNLRKSIVLFNEALTLDPAYALAYVGLAEAHTRSMFGADAPPLQVAELADSAVRRALALAPGLAEAHVQNGINRQWHDFDWRAAEQEYRLAWVANPNAFGAHFGLANLLLTQDRIAAGFEHLRLARELNPLSPLVNTLEAGYLLDAGSFDEARRRLARALDVAPGFWLAHIVQGHFHLAQKRPDEGLAALRQAVVLAQASTQSLSTLGMHLARRGQLDEARTILQQLVEREKTRYVPPTAFAAVQAALGQTGAALDSLAKALVVRDQRLFYLKDDRRWMGLRQEPRFKALMVELKLDRFGPGLSPA